MKRFLMVFLLGLLCSVNMLGTVSASTNFNINDLSMYERMNIYNQQKYSSTDSIFCAALFGFGTGSFIQHDMFGGITGFCFDLIGYSLLFAGVFINAYPYGDLASIRSAPYYMLSGGIVLVSSRAFQLIRPIIITEEKNRKLKIGLDLSFEF